jgi:hypothetical protein
VQDCSVEETEDGAAESEAALENPSDCPSFVWEVAQIHYYVYCVQPWFAVGPHCQQHAHLKEAQQQQQQQLELAHLSTHTHKETTNPSTFGQQQRDLKTIGLVFFFPRKIISKHESL